MRRFENKALNRADPKRIPRCNSPRNRSQPSSPPPPLSAASYRWYYTYIQPARNIVPYKPVSNAFIDSGTRETFSLRRTLRTGCLENGYARVCMCVRARVCRSTKRRSKGNEKTAAVKDIRISIPEREREKAEATLEKREREEGTRRERKNQRK